MPGRRRCCCADTVPCSPCPIPKADLTLSRTAGTVGTLVWSGPDNYWILQIGGPESGVFFILTCGPAGGDVSLFWSNFDESEVMTFADATCSPLHIHFDSTLAGPDDYYVDFP